jgi:hypothetical protein
MAKFNVPRGRFGGFTITPSSPPIKGGSHSSFHSTTYTRSKSNTTFENKSFTPWAQGEK